MGSVKIHIETKRLIIRDIIPEDVNGIFELDSDPDVHIYLGNKPIETIEEAKACIDFVRKQYEENGIGRWAVVEKESQEFIGWTGFKLITSWINNKTQYYDLGYRFIKRAWGRGYATESAVASLDYGFNELRQEEICAMADVNHLVSNKILQNLGMSKMNICDYDGTPHHPYSLTKEQWSKK